MSAFIVNDETIALLVEAILWYGLSSLDRDRLGQHLLDHNYHSVNYCYGESTLVPEYQHEGISVALRNDPYTVYKVARCYDYQSCEHPAYAHSLPRQLITALGAAIEKQLGMTYEQINATEAYDKAPWGL